MSLISQGMPEISGVSKLSWTAGHPVEHSHIDFIYVRFPVAGVEDEDGELEVGGQAEGCNSVDI